MNSQSILKLHEPLNFHEWMRLTLELDEALPAMWKAWAISKVDRDDEVARERYVTALRRVTEIRMEMVERGMP